MLGPSTNLALALELDPELPYKLKSLHIMGGALNHRGNTMPTTEWNVHSDPESLHKVFAAYCVEGLNHYPVLCPLDATESIVLTPDYRSQLVAGGHEILHAADQALEFYMEFHEGDGLGYIAHVHDPFVLAYAVEEARASLGLENYLHLGATTPTVVDVELKGTLTRGQTIADWLGRWGRTDNARVLTSTKPELFFSHYLKVMRANYTQLSTH